MLESLEGIYVVVPPTSWPCDNIKSNYCVSKLVFMDRKHLEMIYVVKINR